MHFLKGLLYTIAGLVVLTAISVAYITQVLDPNDLKPSLINAAKDRGIKLDIDGEISWTFYPWLTIHINSVRAVTDAGTFKAQQIEGDISLLSVFSETLIIDRLIAVKPKLTIDKPVILTKSLRKFSNPLRERQKFIVRSVSISNGEIWGLKPDLTLKQITLEVDRLDSTSAGDFLLKTMIQHRGILLPVRIKSQISPTINFNGLTVRNLFVESRQFKMMLDGYLSVTSDGSIGGEGHLRINPFSLRNWLAAANLPVPITRDLSSLTTFESEAYTKLSNEMISLQNFKVKLDNTEFTGNVDLSLNPLNTNLSGVVTSINIDSYVKKNKDQDSKEAGATFGILPGAYKLDIEGLTINDKKYTDLALEIAVSEDEITLGRLDLNVFGGYLRSSGTHLLAPQITLLSGTLEGFNLNDLPLSPILSPISGNLKGAFDLRVAGRSANEFRQSLSGSLRASVTDAPLQLSKISEALCQIFDKSNRDRDAVTNATIQLSLEFQEGIGVIDTFDATISNTELTGNGRISLLSGATTLSGKLQVSESSDIGNCINVEKIRGLDLPFNCRGNFNQTRMECGLDKSAIQSILQSKTKDIKK